VNVKKFVISTAIIASILVSAKAYAFADQSPNNPYNDDAASQCGRDDECMRRVQKFMAANPRSEHGVFNWIVVIGLIVFVVKFFGSDRKNRATPPSSIEAADQTDSVPIVADAALLQVGATSQATQEEGRQRTETMQEAEAARSRENMRIAEMRAHIDSASNMQIRRKKG